MVARSEAEHRRGPVPEVRKNELARRAVLPCARLAGLRIDQLRIDELVRAEVHAGLLLAFAPKRRPDVADAHRLGDTGAPALLERRAHHRLARDEHAPDARPAQVGELHQMLGIRRRRDDRCRVELLDREEHAFAVAEPDRMVLDADRVQRVERRAGDEGPGGVRREHAITRADAVRTVAARRAGIQLSRSP